MAKIQSGDSNFHLKIDSDLAAYAKIINSDGTVVDFNTLSNTISTANSSIAILTSGNTFVGTAETVDSYNSVVVTVYTDQAGTLYMEFSPDGTNWDSSLSYSVAAATNEVHTLRVTRKYFRVRFTNTAASAQTYFRLQTIYGSQGILTSPLNQAVQQDADAILTKNIDYFTLIAQGKLTGYSSVNKFGKNADIDIGTEDVWAMGGTWVAPTTARIHDLASSSGNDTAAGTGARTVTVYGLNGSYVETSETVTLNGAGNVPTVNSYVFIHRMIVATAGSGGTNAGVITATAQTDATVTISIQTGKGQSQFGIYQIPANKTGYLYGYYGAISGTGGLDLEIFVKPFGGIFNLKHCLTLNSTGSSSSSHKFEIPMVISEKSIVKLSGTATANNTSTTGGFDLILIDN